MIECFYCDCEIVDSKSALFHNDPKIVLCMDCYNTAYFLYNLFKDVIKNSDGLTPDQEQQVSRLVETYGMSREDALKEYWASQSR